MSIFRDREDSLKIGLSFFLIIGTVLGSIFCNCMNSEMKMELYVAERNLISRASLAQTDFGELFLHLLFRRFWQLMLACVCSTTFAAPFLFMVGAGYLGFSTAIIVCSLTMSTGIQGIWKYLLLLFPQCLFYIPAMYILFWWRPSRRKHLTISSAFLLFVIVVFGIFAEAYLNPRVLIFF